MKELDSENALPVIATEIAKREFTLDDVRTIFAAISVAEGETGDNYKALKNKLYKLFPEVREEHTQKNKQWKLMGIRQTRARKKITATMISALNRTQPLIPQVVKWVGENSDDVRNHYSDETCISADIYRYHPQLIARLSKELRAQARKNRDGYYVDKANKETWHYLSHILENERYDRNRAALAKRRKR